MYKEDLFSTEYNEIFEKLGKGKSPARDKEHLWFFSEVM